MEWTDCEEIEVVQGKMGGRPVVKGTRIEPEVILTDEEYGRTPEQTHASFPTLPVDTILKIRAFAHKHQLQP
jgi:uncharacterized protein (DUF433 family)